MYRTARSLGLIGLLIAAGLIMVAGCSKSSDKSTNPPPSGSSFDQPTASVVGKATVQGVAGLTDSAPGWASGDFSSGFGGFGGSPALRPLPESPEGQPVYDQTQHAYVGKDTTTVTVPGPPQTTTTVSDSLWAQFLSGGVGHPSGAPFDSLVAHIKIHTTSHTAANPPTAPYTLDVVYDYALNFVVVPVDTTTHTYNVTGTGSSGGTITLTYTAGGTIVTDVPSYSYNWTLNGVSLSQCPVGTIVVHMGDYTLTASYNGTHVYPYSMTKTGQTDPVESGSLNCDLGS